MANVDIATHIRDKLNSLGLSTTIETDISLDEIDTEDKNAEKLALLYENQTIELIVDDGGREVLVVVETREQ